MANCGGTTSSSWSPPGPHRATSGIRWTLRLVYSYLKWCVAPLGCVEPPAMILVWGAAARPPEFVAGSRVFCILQRAISIRNLTCGVEPVASPDKQRLYQQSLF